MDRHYSAGGIASNTQRYLDRGIKTDITTAAETTVLMASQPTHSDKSHSLESDKILADVQLQLLDLNKQLRQTHRRNSSIVDWKNRTAPASNMKHNRAQRSAGHPSQQAICKNLLRGRACFKGNRCPYFHPPHAQAHIATTDTGLPGFSVGTERDVMTRSQVHVSTQHHHTFNVQIRPDLRSPLVQINLRNNGITFSGVGMLDSGCTTCIIPISRLPEDARRHMSKSNIRVKGIGGNISILGKLTCDITLGDDTSPAFDTLITTSDIPILIGQNILGHHTLLSYTIDNQKATVELTRTLPSGKLKHTVPLSTTVNPRIKPTHNLSHGALTISNEEPRGTTSHSQIIA